MRVAIYVRVSTDKQDTDNQSIQLRDFAAQQGWDVVSEYCDSAVTGRTSERAELKRMFTDASRREFDLLLFWALDRLSREGVLETLQYLRRLEACGVEYRSFTEPYFDSCGIFKDAMLAIMETLAKQESVKRSERTRAGLARVKALGRTLGRPRSVQTSASDVRRLKAGGLSMRAIGRELGISEGSVRRLISQSQ
jgi:DNA invertase Pin-like site-specific DNA recombinase